MRAIMKPSDWPITVKVPLIVILLMISVSVVISNTVLSRLAQTQESHLRTLSQAYLDGLNASLLPHILRDDVWEVYDTLDRAQSAYDGLNALATVVIDGAGQVIAASDPLRFPTAQPLSPELGAGRNLKNKLVIDEDTETARVLRGVNTQGRQIGSIYAEFNVSALLAERQAVLWQLIITNAAITFGLAAIGYWSVWRMVEPVRTLGAYLDRGSDGPVESIPDTELTRATGEFRRLFEQYNAMARSANERLELEQRLAREERLASLGRLASGMAHDINNPLGGLFNALDALKRYGTRETVRTSSINLLERGLNGIRDTVRATLMAYRQPDHRDILTGDDIEDLRYLIQPALKQKGLALEWRNNIDGELRLPGRSIRDATLNLLLNACAASPRNGLIAVDVFMEAASVVIAIRDQGSGMPPAYRDFLENGGMGRRPLRQGEGLGLWMVRRLLDETGASARVEADADGTAIELTFPIREGDMRHVA